MKHFPLILLAGGNGSRMGTPKGLVEYNGRPFLLHQLRQFGLCHGHRAVVVLGHHADDYLHHIPWMKKAQGGEHELEGVRVSVVVNPQPQLGQFSSIQCGARALIHEEKVNGAFILPVDVPAAGHDVWTHLKMAMIGDMHAAMPEWNKRGGHPVLLSKRYLETLLEMPPESRLDVQLHVLDPSHLKRVVVEDPSVCMNINTPEQWKSFAGSENA